MKAYYNENDPKAAAWLRVLIAEGHIAHGDVDDRSISDVLPDDLRGYTQCHFFAGIGGWSRALRLAEWPDDRPVWTGSCPCQPFSVAGKGKGVADERHLWPNFWWLIAQCRPATVFGEQVASKAGREWLTGVRADLETLGYAVGAADLCAAGVGSPHIRQRLWWVADASHEREYGSRNAGQAGRDEHSDGRRTGGLADAGRNVREPHARPGCIPAASGHVEGETQQQQRGGAGAGSGGSLGGLAVPVGAQDDEELSRPATAEAGRETVLLGGCGVAGGLGNAEREGRTREPHAVLGASGETNWQESAWLPCADGKARRIEPSIEPLADGVPARVVRLRGYGNAIVPQVAAAVISAWHNGLERDRGADDGLRGEVVNRKIGGGDDET